MHDFFAALTFFMSYATDGYIGPANYLRSKVLHISARGVTTDPGSIPGCMTTGRDWESHKAAHNWPSVFRVWPGKAVIVNNNLFLTHLIRFKLATFELLDICVIKSRD